MEKEFQVSSDDPLDIFGRSILGARWRTDAGVGLLFCGAASRACTYPCTVRRAGATVWFGTCSREMSNRTPA